MKQLPLDIGLARAPSLASFLAGPERGAWRHLQLWAGSPTRSPVPTYLWGAPGSGKTHLLQAVQESLREQGASAGWLDPPWPSRPPSTSAGPWC
jgi:DnaA family protein